jgi:glycolate oxidase iron-sulfur subunit
LKQVDGSPALKLDPRTYARAMGCVHCGLCLPACPTYNETGHEADSPRGRIQMMRALAEGNIEPTPKVMGHLDLCLDCRACETACPSGVVYHELIEETRSKLPGLDSQGVTPKLMRFLFFHLLTRPGRLKVALLPPRLMQRIGLYQLLRKTGLFKLLPMSLRKMEEMLPEEGPLWPRNLPHRIEPRIARKARVGFLTGCVGSVMFEKVNRQAVELLSACGAEVIVAAEQTCCGAIHHHNGAHEPSMEYARRNIDAFLPEHGEGVDFIATTIAGCGAMIREYDVLLRDDPKYAERAKKFTAKVRDVREVLMQLGLPDMPNPIEQTVTYHDACHLAHAQRVTAQPRSLLGKVPGLKLIPLGESDMCCGAAGTYNLTQPEMATRLADRKLSHIEHTGATVCVTGNVGCAMHIQSRAVSRGLPVKVVHPVEILHRAVFGT